MNINNNSATAGHREKSHYQIYGSKAAREPERKTDKMAVLGYQPATGSPLQIHSHTKFYHQDKLNMPRNKNTEKNPT